MDIRIKHMYNIANKMFFFSENSAAEENELSKISEETK